jgi:hypothetical protein
LELARHDGSAGALPFDAQSPPNHGGAVIHDPEPDAVAFTVALGKAYSIITDAEADGPVGLRKGHRNALRFPVFDGVINRFLRNPIKV